MSNSPVRSVTAQTFEAEVARAAVPVLVDFTATWCPPCRVLAPILHGIAAEGAGRLKVVEVNGDDEPGLAVRFGIRGFPTVIAFMGGKEIARHVGLTSRDKLLQMVRAHLPPGELRPHAATA
ncbi:MULTISPECIES: thioredoxin family protein [Polyangium]|nr:MULTISPECIES: thioredoxin domain-containing protein [Polyangium]MDI1428671.1 thioredoxin domain-containing protein [Polyangium sorediatum]